MAHGYCIANALSGLSASAFSESTAPADTATRAYYNDGRMGRVVAMGSASTSQAWKFDLGSAKALVGVAVLNHNLYSLSPSATIKVEGADDSGFSVNLVEAKAASTVASASIDRKDTVLQFPSVTRRHWKITASWSPSGVCSVGELFALQSVTSLSRASAYGSGEGLEFAVASHSTQVGEIRSALLGGPIVERRMSFADWSASELEELRSMWIATSGPVRSMLWIDKVASSALAASVDEQRCVFGAIAESSFDWVQDDFGVYQPPSLTIRSRAREVGA